MRIDVRFVRQSARGGIQSVVGTFYCYAKVASDVTNLNLQSMIETINDEIEHFYLYNPWWNMNRILRACVNIAAYDN